MKKIINGRKYDTDTAEELCCWSNGYYPNDFNYCEETLYKKKSGEFFLHGKGGANSTYSKCAGNYCYGSSAIVPLSVEEAKAWYEQKGGDGYEEIFGPVGE